MQLGRERRDSRGVFQMRLNECECLAKLRRRQLSPQDSGLRRGGPARHKVASEHDGDCIDVDRVGNTARLELASKCVSQRVEQRIAPARQGKYP